MNFAFWQVFWVAETYTFLSLCDWLGYSFNCFAYFVMRALLVGRIVDTWPGGRGCHRTTCLTIENLWTNFEIRC